VDERCPSPAKPPRERHPVHGRRVVARRLAAYRVEAGLEAGVALDRRVETPAEAVLLRPAVTASEVVDRETPIAFVEKAAKVFETGAMPGRYSYTAGTNAITTTTPPSTETRRPVPRSSATR